MLAFIERNQKQKLLIYVYRKVSRNLGGNFQNSGGNLFGLLAIFSEFFSGPVSTFPTQYEHNRDSSTTR